MARDYVEADRRMVLGFIEPHFMAGFSGGYKGIFPAIADIDSIMHYHRAQVIGDPASTWGVLEGNPTQDQIRFNGALLPVDFLVNLTQNRKRQITRFFCGEVMQAHRTGCAFAKSTAMVACEKPFPIVVTTNSGYPLDQNLYQAVKGMSAANQIVADGGAIVAAAECSDGLPDFGNYKDILKLGDSPDSLLDLINSDGFHMHDQWQVRRNAVLLEGPVDFAIGKFLVDRRERIDRRHDKSAAAGADSERIQAARTPPRRSARSGVQGSPIQLDRAWTDPRDSTRTTGPSAGNVGPTEAPGDRAR